MQRKRETFVGTLTDNDASAQAPLTLFFFRFGAAVQFRFVTIAVTMRSMLLLPHWASVMLCRIIGVHAGEPNFHVQLRKLAEIKE